MNSFYIYIGVLAYLEVIFHIVTFGIRGMNPLFTIGLLGTIACLQVLLVGSLSVKKRKCFFWFFLWLPYPFFAVQTVYYHIFRQPLQVRAIFVGGEDALTYYWREALIGVAESIPFLLLLALPMIGLGILFLLKKWRIQFLGRKQKKRLLIGTVAVIVYCVLTLVLGKCAGAVYAEDYVDYYDPGTVVSEMGVVPFVLRDLIHEIQEFGSGLVDASNELEGAEGIRQEGIGQEGREPNDPGPEGELPEGMVSAGEVVDNRGPEDGADVPDENGTVTSPAEQEPDTSPHAWSIDYSMLKELSEGSKETKWLAEYLESAVPTNKNEYTGMFAGYNLIYLTAEGFSTYAVREDLTPTLYRLLHSGFVFENYYTPLWQTSTSDGEYVNCTGLIPDGQFSMRKSSEIDMACTLPRFFEKEGVYSRAYHNNTLSYYDRYLSHPNLGYDFKAAGLGGLSEKEWGSQIFPMEHPKEWPASDLEMMQGTLPEYINEDRFHVYYMTVSGHMNYNFKGNKMSSKNREAVAGLELSENARAYLACNIELDKALAYLIEELEAAGKLENTVICLSADHYPYGMSMEQYEELAGKDLSGEKDLFRNSLILWNAGMEEPVPVEKVCCSVDVLPTLLNLFGFDYDSRMYAGRDILSDEEGLVIFNDRSFVSDSVVYDRKKKETVWKKEMTEEEQKEYLENRKDEVKDRYTFSAYILRNDYYRVVKQSVMEETK